MGAIASEVRAALRNLIRDARTSFVSIALFAVTIGVTTSIYAIVNAVLLQPIGMRVPDRTVVLWQHDEARNTPIVEIAYGEMDAWRRGARSLDAVGLFGSVNWNLTLVQGTTRWSLPFAAVSAPFFNVVGTPPALGRLFTSSDEEADAPRVAIISDQLWREHFGADPHVLGTVVRVQDDVNSPLRSIEIVGVMPADFDFPRGARLWLPAAPAMRAYAQRAGEDVAGTLGFLRVFYGLGRLHADAGVGRATDELSALARRAAPSIVAGATSGVVVTPVKSFLQGPARPVLWTMFGGTLLMVLLACSSVAGVQVFRAARADRTLSIQLALGAPRRRLIARAVLEGAFLSAAGLAGAIVIAFWSTRWLIASAPLDVPHLADARVASWPVLLFMSGLTISVGILASAWPAMFVGGIDATGTLRSGARTVMHPRERRLQHMVVGWQVAVAVVLLAGAALFVRSVSALDRTDIGFQPDNLVSIGVVSSFKDAERSDAFYDALLSRVRELSGVASAGAVYLRPLSGPIGNDMIPVLAGQEGLDEHAPWRSNPLVNVESVTPGYFRTLGTPLVRGRDFAPSDVAATENVVIVSASAAAKFWPGKDPIGQRLVVPTQRVPGTIEKLRWQVVVGVVGDVRYRGLHDPRLDFYLPSTQSTVRVQEVLIRLAVPAEPILTRVQAIARELDPDVHTGDGVLMSDAVAHESAPWRFAMRVLTFFGGLGAMLATTGLVGVVWMVVALQRRELAVRAALGATSRQLQTFVLRDAFWTTTVAIIAGLAGALAGGRLLDGMLVGTSAYDAFSLAAAAVVTFVAGSAGCLLAARGATRINPADALRD